ncbi:MAG: helix-turn-helix domain-containing protein [Cyclobacteriaceae bacterium]|nr:helix-turn-helix domain-containing protein [Cyclobacteriaceae bacterium]
MIDVHELNIDDNNKSKILLIENNESHKKLIYTQRNFYNIIEKEPNDLDKRDFKPDLIIANFQLCKQKNYCLIQQLKNTQSTINIPVICLGGKLNEEEIIQGYFAGISDIIPSSISSEYLFAKIKYLISKKKGKNFINNFCQDIDGIKNLSERSFVNKIKTIINKNITKSEFNAEMFCREANMSRMQFYRKIKSTTGYSANSYIKEQRLLIASQFLMDNEENVSQIGFKVGFNDPSYFIKCFKEKFKCTPKEYANQFKNQKKSVNDSHSKPKY